MKHYILITTLLLTGVTIVAQQTAPGGVEGAWHWWRTESSNTHQHKWLMGEQELPYSNAEGTLINHWPSPNWQRLTQPQLIELPGTLGNSVTVFIVYHPPANDKEEVLWSLQQGNQIPLVSTNKRLADLQKRQYLNFLDDRPITRLQTYRHAAAPSEDETYLFGFGQLTTHSSIPASQWAAPIAEFILFPKVLDSKTQLQVESYLALKYGTTLGLADRPSDYLSSIGEVIWDGTENGDFHHRIFGIGKDLVSGWDQGRSHSAEAVDLLHLQLQESDTQNGLNPTSLSDQHILVIGDNNEALTWQEDNEWEILERQWLAQFTGSFSDQLMDIQLDLGRWLGSDIDAYEYQLVIDANITNGFGLQDATGFSLDEITDGRYGHFRAINWPDTPRALFTFARRPISTVSNALQALRVYPNPMSDQDNWQWQLRLPHASSLSASLTNAKGQQLWQRNYIHDSYFAATERPLPVGIYWLNLKTNSQTFTQKIVVQ